MLERRVEGFDEIEVHARARAMQRKIQPGCADDIEIWEMVFCSKNTADGKVGEREFFEAAKMCFHRARLF